MGSEDLFHKRKAKSQQDFKRGAAKRASYEKILIVCEGEKTEPHYFTELKDYYRLNNANVEISGECGSDPLSVVKCGKKRYKDEKNKGDAYDRVYCVIDHDNRKEKYGQALAMVASAQPKNTFFTIASIPCFEYWLLLHFAYTTAPFSATGDVSVAEAVLKSLKKHWPEYAKASQGTFLHLLDRLDTAKANATQALAEAKCNNTNNPSTQVHELVDYLQNIKKPVGMKEIQATAGKTC